MKAESRNRRRQLERMEAYQEADQTIRDLHALCARPGRRGMSVGQMVGVAAQMGLLCVRPRFSGAYVSTREETPA